MVCCFLPDAQAHVITASQHLHGMKLSHKIHIVIEYAHVHRHAHRNSQLVSFVLLMYSLGSLKMAIAL